MTHVKKFLSDTGNQVDELERYRGKFNNKLTITCNDSLTVLLDSLHSLHDSLALAILRDIQNDPKQTQ